MESSNYEVCGCCLVIYIQERFLDDLPGSASRRPGSPLLCPGASRKTKNAGHSPPFLRQGRRNDSDGTGIGQRWLRKASPREGGVRYMKTKRQLAALGARWRSQKKSKTPAGCRRYKSWSTDGEQVVKHMCRAVQVPVAFRMRVW